MARAASIHHWLKVTLLLLGGLGAAAAAETFPEEVAVGDTRLSKVAEARYSLLWKRITDVALYVDPDQPRPERGDILSADYAKYLTIEYGLSVSAERFRKMSRDLLEDNWPRAELDQHRESVDRFLGWLRGVENGDRYAVYWLPDQGLSLALNGEPLGNLRDAEGAAVVLSLWLGRAAVSESQRDELLAIWRDDGSR